MKNSGTWLILCCAGLISAIINGSYMSSVADKTNITAFLLIPLGIIFDGIKLYAPYQAVRHARTTPLLSVGWVVILWVPLTFFSVNSAVGLINDGVIYAKSNTELNVTANKQIASLENQIYSINEQIKTANGAAKTRLTNDVSYLTSQLNTIYTNKTNNLTGENTSSEDDLFVKYGNYIGLGIGVLLELASLMCTLSIGVSNFTSSKNNHQNDDGKLFINNNQPSPNNNDFLFELLLDFKQDNANLQNKLLLNNFSSPTNQSTSQQNAPTSHCNFEQSSYHKTPVEPVKSMTDDKINHEFVDSSDDRIQVDYQTIKQEIIERKIKINYDLICSKYKITREQLKHFVLVPLVEMGVIRQKNNNRYEYVVSDSNVLSFIK